MLGSPKMTIVLSIAALTILVTFAALKGTAWHVVGCAVFGTTLAAGAWHHFAVVRNGITISLYLDGALAGIEAES